MRHVLITSLERLIGILTALSAVAILGYAGYAGYHSADITEGVLRAAVIGLGGMLLLVAISGSTCLMIDIHENLRRLAALSGDAMQTEPAPKPPRLVAEKVAAPRAVAKPLSSPVTAQPPPVFSTRAMPAPLATHLGTDQAPQDPAPQWAKAAENPTPSQPVAESRPRLVADRRPPR